MTDYPLFLFPSGVPLTPSHDWTSNESKIYFDWFLSVKDERANYLLTALDENLTGNAGNDIKRIGQKVYDHLFIAPFSNQTENGIKITNKGLALAADLGILTSNLVLSSVPKLSWERLEKGKRHVYFRLPVIVGFSDSSNVEPIRFSTSGARAILEGRLKSDIWFKFFEACLTK